MLDNWAQAVGAAESGSPIVIVGERTGQVGDWEPEVGDNNKRALYAGLFEGDASLGADAPPDGEVTWADGTTTAVALSSARTAVEAIRAETESPCDDCAPLRITAARLTTGPIETSRGPATAPVWELAVHGTAVKLTRVAIADSTTVVPPRQHLNDPKVGVRIESAMASTGGRELTVTFIGAPGPASQGCGADYTAEAVESDLALVAIVGEQRPLQFGACTAAGATRTATATLSAPLGVRSVLDIQQGLPVPVTLTP